MRRNGAFLELAYSYVKTLILDGAVEPGERIDVDAVVAHLQFSRQPVRDAINRLAAEGFVTVIPQVGCVVPVVTVDDARDFLDVFAACEGRMAAFAAERRTPEQLGALRAIAREMDELLGASDALSLRAAGPPLRAINHRLHVAVHAMAGTPAVRRIADGLLDQYDFYIASAVSLAAGRFYPLPAHAEHLEVIAAIADRDGPRASALMERHVRDSVNRLLAHLSAKSTDVVSTPRQGFGSRAL